MKLLGLLRHAKSDWDNHTLKDFDRGLNRRGRKGAALMGRHIADHGVAWERVVASPAERVKRTIDKGELRLTIGWDERLYLASAASLLQVLREIEGDPDSVLLVGHNPGLHDLILDLVPPTAENDLLREAAKKFPTAAFAVLECDVERWSELEGDSARLIHFARPRDFDPELGPERSA